MTFTGLTTGEDIEERLGVRYLARFPRSSRWPSVESTAGQRPAGRPALGLCRKLPLAARVDRDEHHRGADHRDTSALPEEGKTTTSICLARSMAATGDRILLIDGDLRRQGVSRFLRGGEGRPG
jgi:hypothetical protein